MTQALGNRPLHLFEGLPLLRLTQQRHKATRQWDQEQAGQQQTDQPHLAAEQLLAQACLGGHQRQQAPRQDSEQVGGKEQGRPLGGVPLLKSEQ